MSPALRKSAIGRLLFCMLSLLAPAILQQAHAQAASAALVMIEEPGCPYCRRWDAEVRAAYVASPEGKFAPLERHFKGDSAVRRFPNVVYSPTFILTLDGREIGRIIGYAGADFFWGELGELVAKAGFRPEAPPASRP